MFFTVETRVCVSERKGIVENTGKNEKMEDCMHCGVLFGTCRVGNRTACFFHSTVSKSKLEKVVVSTVGPTLDPVAILYFLFFSRI